MLGLHRSKPAIPHSCSRCSDLHRIPVCFAHTWVSASVPLCLCLEGRLTYFLPTAPPGVSLLARRTPESLFLRETAACAALSGPTMQVACLVSAVLNRAPIDPRCLLLFLPTLVDHLRWILGGWWGLGSVVYGSHSRLWPSCSAVRHAPPLPPQVRIDRIHHVGPRRPSQKQSLRNVVITFHYYSKKEGILRKARTFGTVTFQMHSCLVFQDIAQMTLAQSWNKGNYEKS